jgi:3-oxoadipate enol-lactonase
VSAVHSRTLGKPDGPWLVLCHGMALDHRDLLPLGEAAAARGWRVLLWDMPGHGASPPTGDWSVAGMTGALEALLDDRGIAACALLGFSFGGVVAQELVRRRPGMVTALVAYACLAPRATGPAGPAWLADLLLRWRSWDALRQSFAVRCAITPAAQKLVREAMAPLGKAAFLAMTRALLAEVPLDPAFALPCLLLLVAGERDPNGTALGRAQDALEKLVPSAERVTIPNAGHCAHLDRPQVAEAAILDFLDAHRRPYEG